MNNSDAWRPLWPQQLLTFTCEVLFPQVMTEISKVHLEVPPGVLSTYHVALQADELHPGLQVLVGVAAENLDELHQVRAELVASLQDAQDRDVFGEVVEDVAGQALYPGDVSW